jgi:integrase
MTTTVRIKGIKRFQHRKSGIWYTYHRASGTCIEPPHPFGSAEFMVALAAAEARHKSKKAGKGTFGELVDAYKVSSAYLTLKDRTRSDYEKVFDWLRGAKGKGASMPIAQFDSAFVRALREKAFQQRKRRFANYVMAVVSLVFSHAIEARNPAVKLNPAAGVKKVRRPTDEKIANRAWTEDEKRVVLDEAPAHLVPPIAIARWSGMREGDIIHLPKTAYRDGALNLTTAKRGVPHWYPCPKPLAEILDAIPPNDGMTLCVSSRGTPWTEDGFRSSFFKLIRRLTKESRVQPGLTFHGLRTSFGEEAREHGFDVRSIADAMAQRDTKSAEHYVRNADKRRSAKAVSAALDGTELDQKVSTKVSTQRYGRARKAAK